MCIVHYLFYLLVTLFGTKRVVQIQVKDLLFCIHFYIKFVLMSNDIIRLLNQ